MNISEVDKYRASKDLAMRNGYQDRVSENPNINQEIQLTLKQKHAENQDRMPNIGDHKPLKHNRSA